MSLVACHNSHLHGKDFRLCHVLGKLSWNLLQNFFGKLVLFVSFQEFYKLYGITSSYNTVWCTEHTTVTIESFHLLELLVTNTHNNDTARKSGCFNDKVNGLGHVENFSISQQKHHTVAVLLHAHLGNVQELSDDRCEVCWTRKSDSWKLVSVQSCDTLSSLYLRILFIKVQSKAMRSCVCKLTAWGNTTKSVHWERSVTIIGL